MGGQRAEGDVAVGGKERRNTETEGKERVEGMGRQRAEGGVTGRERRHTETEGNARAEGMRRQRAEGER